MKLIYSIVFSLLGTSILLSSSLVQKSPTPKWVKNIRFTDNTIVDGPGAYQYFLVDNQDNIKKESVYRHIAVKILNSEGVQSMSDIDIVFDPTFQSLMVNVLKIIRNGEVIDKLDKTKIKTIQRETSMDRNFYDGSLSAILNLSDVREGDIIEYAFTIDGFNPIRKNTYAGTFYQSFSIPVNRVFTRIISDRDLYLKKNEGATDPKIIKSHEGKIEYSWDRQAREIVLFDNNVPAWFDPQARVTLSTFGNWNEVVQWALPLYDYDKTKIGVISKSVKSHGSLESKIISLIHMVQDDVRYLGFESGIGAYRPNPPSKVFDQRFGDCKDKSLLLVSLLRHEGIKAFPLLVNTKLKQEVEELLPSSTAFDHCIVNFKYKEKEYFVDPTMANQGGDLDNLTFPSYRKGLLIKPDQNTLIDIPQNDPARIDIHEIIDVKEIGGEAHWIIRSEFSGSSADLQRLYFQTNSLESIGKEYLNYYSSLYPGIESDAKIKFLDNNRNTDNKVVIEEQYNIKKFWVSSEEENQINALIYPLLLESKINYTKSAERTMPYYLGTPYTLKQKTEVDLPEDWNFEDSQDRIEGEGFEYQSSKTGRGRHLIVEYNYKVNKDYISGDSVTSFLDKHEKIQNSLSYYLTYNKNFSGFKLSWISILLSLMAIAASIYFGVSTYKKYDPEPWKYAMDTPIGAWLILPAIGLTISPFVLLKSIVTTTEYFNHQTWLAYMHSGTEYIDVMMLMGIEMIYNFLFLGLTIFLVISFYKRRTSVPLVATVFYILNFTGPLLDAFFTDMVVTGTESQFDNPNLYKNALRSFVGLIIWVPYFNLSERAKNTFCKQYKK